MVEVVEVVMAEGEVIGAGLVLLEADRILLCEVAMLSDKLVRLPLQRRLTNLRHQDVVGTTLNLEEFSLANQEDDLRVQAATMALGKTGVPPLLALPQYVVTDGGLFWYKRVNRRGRFHE